MVLAMIIKRGFTLIELLVVISVIGILISVIAASFTTSQKRGRDVKRRADLAAIQQSLEQCFVLNAVYPTAAMISFGSALTCGMQTTMNLVPLDPKNAAPYVYTYTINAGLTSYCLCALLEQTGAGNAGTVGVGGSCSFGGSKNYQCIGSQQ
ncbi:hypothetical protein CO018_02450 [Candidatus Beckwithbacteria bacterium CG_4_9_14_0_2_um_filter_47_11]|uniref:Type II secretion system protein GspG C-terminal domain-containing protein n=1 Tax=Candidatus Beckwithbacteria bacterium CG_4_9_14_0_2_um_filter_47_11 TaxID=1974494 RepID=A0A2M8G3Y1_9BACT|nr:MAG: hypothetical protein CO018_02450 [Candidatus Beckwithbacteria bacterium CG_4_9_14_0_2_um_filter_47_11]